MTPRTRRWSVAGLIALTAGAMLGCGQEAPHILYSQNAQSLDNPLPDLRLSENGSVALRKDWYQPFLMEEAKSVRMMGMLEDWALGLHDNQGTGNIAPTLLRTSAPVDKDSFKGVVARLVKTDNGYQVLERNVEVEHSRDRFERENKPFPANHPEFLFIRAGVPLPENAEGLLVVLRGGKTKEGELLGRGNEFNADASVRQHIQDAAQALQVPESDVLLTLPLRGESAGTTMQRLAQWVQTQHTPLFEIPEKGFVGQEPMGTWDSEDADWNTMQTWLNVWAFGNPAPDVGKVIVGSFKSKDLRDSHGVWRSDLMDNPSAAPDADLHFTLMLPKGPKPEGGYRIVLGGHGLNSRNTLVMGNPSGFCTEVGQLLARGGMGCLGIDAVNHGRRGQAFDFFDMDSLQRTRDNFRQSMLDLIQLARLAQVLDIDGDGTADIAPELGYLGNSLGSILGAGVVSYIPQIQHAVLNVGGAELGNVLSAIDIEDKIGLLVVAKTGVTFRSPEYYSSFALFRAIGQWMMEPTDPINLTANFPERWPDRAVLLQEGIGDITIPNFTTENLAKAMGLTPQTQGVVGSSRPLQVLSRVDPARYASPERVKTYNGHNVFWDFPVPREQALQFLQHRGTQLLIE